MYSQVSWQLSIFPPRVILPSLGPAPAVQCRYVAVPQHLSVCLSTSICYQTLDPSSVCSKGTSQNSLNEDTLVASHYDQGPEVGLLTALWVLSHTSFLSLYLSVAFHRPSTWLYGSCSVTEFLLLKDLWCYSHCLGQFNVSSFFAPHFLPFLQKSFADHLELILCYMFS